MSCARKMPSADVETLNSDIGQGTLRKRACYQTNRRADGETPGVPRTSCLLIKRLYVTAREDKRG